LVDLISDPVNSVSKKGTRSITFTVDLAR
jgi:hypothetical protein